MVWQETHGKIPPPSPLTQGNADYGKKNVKDTNASTHLLGPDAGEQLILPEQQIPLESPFCRVRSRDRELAAAQVNLVVLAEVHVCRASLGVHRARHPVEAGVTADGAEESPHLGAGLEARGAAQDPLLDAADGHAVKGKEREAHLCADVY